MHDAFLDTIGREAEEQDLIRRLRERAFVLEGTEAGRLMTRAADRIESLRHLRQTPVPQPVTEE